MDCVCNKLVEFDYHVVVNGIIKLGHLKMPVGLGREDAFKCLLHWEKERE